MREVDQANVIVTDNNAYVAAKLANHNGNRLEKDIENKISDVVKSTDQNIDNVYVSVNPDFYERTTSYANDIRNGRPIAGFFDEFNTLVRRIFRLKDKHQKIVLQLRRANNYSIILPFSLFYWKSRFLF